MRHELRPSGKDVVLCCGEETREVGLSHSPGRLDGAIGVETRVSIQHAQYFAALTRERPERISIRGAKNAW